MNKMQVDWGILENVASFAKQSPRAWILEYANLLRASEQRPLLFHLVQRTIETPSPVHVCNKSKKEIPTHVSELSERIMN